MSSIITQLAEICVQNTKIYYRNSQILAVIDLINLSNIPQGIYYYITLLLSKHVV